MLSQAIQELLKRFQGGSGAKSSSGGESVVHVDEIAAKVAAFYEKIRSIVDYQDEHLMRKRFIFRILRRRLFVSLDTQIAEGIIKEIIRAGHLPNDTVSDSEVSDVQRIIDNYALMRRKIPSFDRKDQKDIGEWLLNVTVSTIEEVLFPPTKDRMLATLMFSAIRDNIVVRGASLEKEEMDLQLFVAIQRALLRVDASQLHYRLLKVIYPKWDSLTSEECEKIADDLPEVKEGIEEVLAHPHAPAFFKLCNHYNTVFHIYGDILKEIATAEEFALLVENEDKLEAAVTKAYQERYKKQKKMLGRMAFFSVLSFFLSKIVIALAIEIPIEVAITNTFSLLNTGLNIVIPPILMLLITMAIRMPSKENEELIVDEVKRVAYEKVPKEYTLHIRKKKGMLVQLVVRLVYFLMFVVSFYLLHRLLSSINFSTANIIVFTFFASLIAATGVKINNRSRDISLEKEKARFWTFVIDLFVMPFVSIGQVVIAGLIKFNIFVILFNLVVELPFQFFVEFLENFHSFIKIKKEEIH